MSHISGKLFSEIKNEKFKALIQKENSEVLRPDSQPKDGSQLIQTAQTGVHRSPFSLNTLASTPAQAVPGVVLSGTAPHCGFKHTQMNRRCRAEAQQELKTYHRPRDPTRIIQATEA